MLVNATARRSLARTILAGGIAAAALAAGSASAGAASVAPAVPCADADLNPTPANAKQVRAAILCLTNADRTQHGLPALVENARLRRAANGHSDDMVGAGYFAHTAPAGATFVDRIVAARYVGRADSWSLGENLAWGTGALGTPAGVESAWMRSSGHRANILKRAYREIGIGIELGIPTDAGVGATYTMDFGVRS